MNFHGKEIKIFSANSNPKVAQDIATCLGTTLGQSEVKEFSDGEISVTINETVRGADVFVVQSTSHPVNTNLMELLIMIDAFKRASAARITAVIPYFGYARQDRKSKARDPITAKLVANLIETAGADRVLTMDLHASQEAGFFDIPVDHLMGVPILTPYFQEKFKDDIAAGNVVIVSPDLGSVTRVRKFAEKLDCKIAIIDKRRPKANVSEVMNIIGDVKGKKCILVDDMIDTAGTLTNAAKALKEIGGADSIYACATHGVFSGPAIERIEASEIEKIVILDTIMQPEKRQIEKIECLPVGPVFAEAIQRIYLDKPVSPLFV